MNTTSRSILKAFTAALFVSFALAGLAPAVTVTVVPPSNGNFEWDDPAIWAPDGNLPGTDAGDFVILNQGRTVNVHNDIPVAPNSFDLQVSNTNSGTLPTTILNIDTDTTTGGLTVEGILRAGTGVVDEGRINVISGALNSQTRSEIGVSGTLNVSGGTFTGNTVFTLAGGGAVNVNGGDFVTDTAIISDTTNSASFNLSAGSFANNATGTRALFGNGTCALVVSGGTFTAQGAAPAEVLIFRNDSITISGGVFDCPGGQVIPSTQAAGDQVWTVEGSAATIRVDRFNAGTAITRAPTINLNFDANGISPVRSFSFMSLNAAIINVDGSAYTGPVGEIDLFKSFNLAGPPATTPVVTGFVGYDAAVNVRSFTQAEVTDIQCVADSGGSLNDTYFDVSGAGGTHRFWYDVDTTGAAPADPGAGVHEIDITAGATADAVAAATQVAVDAQADFGAAVSFDLVTVTDAAVGPRDNAIDSGGTGFTITVVANGADLPQDLYLSLTPNISDPDGDGLSNFDEVAVHGTDPGLADTDGDGVNDGDEVTAGSDPLAADSAIIALVLDSLNSLSGIAISQLTPSGPDFLLALKLEESADLQAFTDLDLVAGNPVVDEVADTITFTVDGSALKKFVRLNAE